MSVATIRRVVCRMGPDHPPTDAELVIAITPSGFGGDREAAFVEILDRYGPMVLGVCHRVLGDAHDAEDAFQAVFLVLARKAGTIQPPGAVAGWLYGVAVRTARKAKTTAARRRRREMATAEAGRVCEPASTSIENAELRAVIDTELAALPDPQRAVVVLCDLHGKTRAEAASELNRPEGTVAAWLARGRKALAARLARRGVALPAAGLLAVVTPTAVSANSVSVAVATFLGRGASPAVLALAGCVMKSLSNAPAKLVAVMVAVGSVLAAVATAAAWPTGEANPGAPNAPEVPVAAAPALAALPAKPERPVAWKEAKVLSLAGWISGSAVYSPDGKTLFVGGTNGLVRAYDTASWKQLWEYGAQTNCPSVAVSPDGKSLAVTFKDADRRWGIRMINAATGKLAYSLEEAGKPGVLGPEPYAVGFFTDTLLDGGQPPLTAHKVIFGTAGGYVVKTWVNPEKPSTITSSTVAEGKLPADYNAVPLAVDPDSKRVVVTGPIDKDTGKNVLWAWAAGSGAGNKLLEGHKAAVVCAAWSTNGKVIVTGDAGGVVIVWDAATFKEKSQVKLGGRVVAVAASPDGMGIAASAIRPNTNPQPGQAGCTGDVFVWLTAFPPEKPESLSSTPTGTPFNGIASLAFAPDGKSLASTFANFVLLSRTGILLGQVKIFSVAPAEPEKPAPAPVRNVTDVSFAPDGKKYVAVVSGNAEVFDTDSGKQLYSISGVTARFSADGKQLFVMGEKVLVCDTDTGKTISSYDRPKTKFGWQKVAFAPSGKQFAAHFGTHVRVYDTATGKEVALNKQLEMAGGVVVGSAEQELRWSSDGKAIVAGGILVAENHLGMAVWGIESGKQQFTFTPDAKKPTGAAAFASGGRIAIVSGDVVELWVFDGEASKNPERKYRAAGPVTAVAFSKDGKLIAVGARLPILNGADKPPAVLGHKSIVQVFDATTAEEVKRLDGFEGVNHVAPTKLPVTALAFAPDGKKLVAGTGPAPADLLAGLVLPNGEVKVFNLGLPPEKPAPAPALNKWNDATVLTEHGRLVNGVTIAPDGKSFAAATDGGVICWDLNTRKKLWTHKPADLAVSALVYSPDSKHLCLGINTDVIRLDATTGKNDPWIDDNMIWFGKVHAMAYHPDDGRLAASDGYVTRVRGLNLMSEDRTLGKQPKGPAAVLPASVAWSPDGKRLALIQGEKDGDTYPVTVWTVDEKEKNVATLTAHDNPVTAVAWSKDGKVIASGDEKGVVILWDAATGKELWRKKFTGRDNTAGRINALALSPADNTVAVAVSMGSGKGPERVVLLAGDSGKDVEHVMRPWSIPVSSVAWSKDGKILITGCGAAGRVIAQNEPPIGEVVVWENVP